MKTKTKTYTVTPINSIDEVRKDYDWVYSGINNETAQLEIETGIKEVQLIKYDTTMTTEQILADFKKRGLKPASPNALLGFAKEHFDVLEKYQWLVAPSSVFQDDGRRCFLRVGRSDGERELVLIRVGGGWVAARDWVFLAESLGTASETLETSDTLPLNSAIKIIKQAGYKIFKEL